MSAIKYRYSYLTQSEFTPAVTWHFFKLRAVPCSNEFQRVVSSRLEVLPSCRVSHSVDGQGNAVQWGSFDAEHAAFSVASEGEVEQIGPYVLHEAPAPYYLTATRLTSLPAADAEVRELRSRLGASGGSVFGLAAEVMHHVHRRIAYTPCHTTTATTAAEVWADGRGVCQDYAHVMIALCRLLGLHARYANGLIGGDGQTHAWVEVSDGHEWRAFDPTHDESPQWGYIKIAHGRDADDCPTNRGRIYAWTREQMTIHVTAFTVSDDTHLSENHPIKKT